MPPPARNARQSLAPSTAKARQLSHLNSQLAQLQAHLADLQDIMRVTAVQAENIKALGGLNGALLMAAGKVLGEPFDPNTGTGGEWWWLWLNDDGDGRGCSCIGTPFWAFALLSFIYPFFFVRGNGPKASWWMNGTDGFLLFLFFFLITVATACCYQYHLHVGSRGERKRKEGKRKKKQNIGNNPHQWKK